MIKSIKTRIVVKRSEKGQDLAEYAILIGLISITVVLALSLIGGELRDIFDHIVAEFPW
jgi:Flp pilus assembly pilin Flp